MGFLTIVYAIAIFCFLIMFHELGHFFAARLMGIRVNELALGMGPLLLEKQGKETRYVVRLLPIGGYCSMEGEDKESEDSRAFNRKPAPARAFVVAAGALMNLLLAVVILSCVASYAGVATGQISAVEPGSSAQLAGIRAGDRIVEANGQKVIYFSDARRQIQESNSEVELVLLRDGTKIYMSVPVAKNEQGISVIGVEAEVTRSPLYTVRYGVKATYTMGAEMLRFIGQLFTGESSVNELSGPVGIVSAISYQAQRGFIYVANLAALISLNLGILNMLPLPALDGGRLLFIVINLLTGHAVSEETEGKIHFAGIMMLFGLMAYVLIQDIGRLL